jgi:hypothetical protein
VTPCDVCASVGAWVCGRHSERVVGGCVGERVVGGCVGERVVGGWVGERVGEWLVGGWVSEWVSKWVSEWKGMDVFTEANETTRKGAQTQTGANETHQTETSMLENVLMTSFIDRACLPKLFLEHVPYRCAPAKETCENADRQTCRQVSE